MYLMQPSWRPRLAVVLLMIFMIVSSQACSSSSRPRCDRTNCQWSSWSDQGSCNVRTGYLTQTRYKTVAEKCGGSCYGSTTRTLYMRTSCVWGSWGTWGSCSGNRQWRSRTKSRTEKCGYCSGASRMSRYATCSTTATCGMRKVSLSSVRPAIYNGVDVYPPGKWPWMVTVNSGGSFCGGAIIAKNWVLTAGHCVYRSSVERTYVRAGRHDLDRDESTQQIRFASLIEVHPDYEEHASQPFKLMNDFALIKLKNDFVYNDRVQPICVATSTYGLTGCHSIGWGRTSPTDAKGVLQEAPVTIASATECKQRFRYDWLTSGKVLCVKPSSLNGDSRICGGDSGSPLVCRQSNGQYVTVGPASFGRSNCTGITGVNSAYGDITKIVSFIRQKCANCI